MRSYVWGHIINPVTPPEFLRNAPPAHLRRVPEGSSGTPKFSPLRRRFGAALAHLSRFGSASLRLSLSILSPEAIHTTGSTTHRASSSTPTARARRTASPAKRQLQRRRRLVSCTPARVTSGASTLEGFALPRSMPSRKHRRWAQTRIATATRTKQRSQKWRRMLHGWSWSATMPSRR